LLQPLLGLAAAGELAASASENEWVAFDEKREAEIMNGGAAPAFAVSLALVAAYLQGPVSTGGALPLPLFAALNNGLGWGITMASLGVLALESFTAALALLVGLFCCLSARLQPASLPPCDGMACDGRACDGRACDGPACDGRHAQRTL
jgi:hypothetical protein